MKLLEGAQPFGAGGPESREPPGRTQTAARSSADAFAKALAGARAAVADRPEDLDACAPRDACAGTGASGAPTSPPRPPGHSGTRGARERKEVEGEPPGAGTEAGSSAASWPGAVPTPTQQQSRSSAAPFTLSVAPAERARSRRAPTATSTSNQSPERTAGAARASPRARAGADTDETEAPAEGKTGKAPPAERPQSLRMPSAPPSSTPRRTGDRDGAQASPLGEAVARSGSERIARAVKAPDRDLDAKAASQAPRQAIAHAPAHAQGQAAVQAASPDAPRTIPAASPAPAPAAPLPVDPRGDVAGAILPAAAHLRVSSDTLGELTLHLRIRDGAAHVRIEAPATAPVEARAPELARALAADGIELARLDVEPTRAPQPATPTPEAALRPDAGGGHDPGRHGGDRDDREPPAAGPPSPRRVRTSHGGKHHVTA